jgi:hypothetical protein
MKHDLPESLLRFIELAIPTYHAAEVLLFLAAGPERGWTAEEIVVGMRPVVITLPAVNEYLAVFKIRGIVQESEGRFRYGPVSPEIENAVGALAHAYNERPVTLIATIYRTADSRIRSFSDSFKLRED